LLFNPNNLFDVGFQLSYAAVFGIVFLKPRLDRILILRNRIIRYGWDLISVSISAQIATFPLTVCYFHQIPVYSCLANLLVIPLVTLLIPLGLGLLLFNWIPTFTAICGHAVDFILPCMIRFLEWIEDLPFSSIGFYFSNLEMVFVCSIFFFAFLFIESTNKRFFKAILFLCLFLAVTSLAEKTERLFRREIIVYNCSGSTIIHLISGRNNYVIAGDSTWEDGIVRKIVDETVGRLQLDEPFFLESNAFYRDSLLFLKEGIIFFEGKMISLGKHPDLTFFKPQFLIGSFSDIDAKRMKFTDQKMISTLRVTKDFSNDRSEVFFLQAEGAYREKW